MDGFRYQLKQGGKAAQEKFGSLERSGAIDDLIIGSNASGPIELKMDFLDETMAVLENPVKTFPILVC